MSVGRCKKFAAISLRRAANNTAQRWNTSGQSHRRENAGHADHRKAAMLEFCQLELLPLLGWHSESKRNTGRPLDEGEVAGGATLRVVAVGAAGFRDPLDPSDQSNDLQSALFWDRVPRFVEAKLRNTREGDRLLQVEVARKVAAGLLNTPAHEGQHADAAVLQLRVPQPTHGIVADEAAEAKRVPDPVAELLAHAEVLVQRTVRGQADR